MRKPEISLILVIYKSERWILRCLESLYGDGFSGRCFLIDNHQLEPEVLAAIRSRFPQVVYHRTGTNLGFGRANNLGVSLALDGGAEIVGILNPDTWFERSWWQPILDVFQTQPQY